MRGLSAAILVAVTAWAGAAISGDDAFEQAVNYVFPETPREGPLNC